MNLITIIVIGAVLGYVFVITRALAKAPSNERPNYAEKELSHTFLDYRAPKKVRKFYIKDDGTVVRRDGVRHDLCGC